MLSKEDFIMLNHYLREGLPKAAIARKLGISRMTVHPYAEAGLKFPASGVPKTKVSILGPFKEYLKSRLTSYPELYVVRLYTEITVLGYKGKYTRVKDYVHSICPKAPRTLYS